jgi:DNA (cytosine-5)-methyltransferase 1
MNGSDLGLDAVRAGADADGRRNGRRELERTPHRERPQEPDGNEGSAPRLVAGSLFSGVGGLDLGLARAGFEHAFFAELDPWRRRVLAAHFPGIHIYEDVRDVERTDERSPDERAYLRRGDGRAVAPGADERSTRRDDVAIDLLCGGFPCQDLSVAGRRRGLAGARSGLFHEFARIADALRPSWVLLENVPGLLSSNDGRDMGVVLGSLADLGYGWAYRVLDARYFGVPQRRRRVFIVGRAGGDAESALRVVCEGCGGDSAPRVCSWTRPTGSAGNGAAVAGSLLGSRGKGGGGLSVEEVPNLVIGALRSSDGGPDAAHALEGSLIPAPAGVRRLTPVECERLMGWPDNWTAPEGVKSPDSRRYAACGDGVVANVAEWIGRGILAEA